MVLRAPRGEPFSAPSSTLSFPPGRIKVGLISCFFSTGARTANPSLRSRYLLVLFFFLFRFYRFNQVDGSGSN